MPHLVTPHCAKVGVLFTHSAINIACENTFAVRDATDAIFSDLASLADYIWLQVIADLVPASAVEVVYNGISIEDVSVLPYGGATFAKTATPGTGSGLVAELPTSSALSIKKQTAALGRSGRGRWYWPVWDAAELASGDTVATAKANGYLTALTDFQSAVEGYTVPLEVGIISQQSGKVVRPQGLFEPITGWTYFDTSVDNQRRRLLGRGR